jgi:serine/threonine-protein phosphatase 2A activator
MRRCEIHNILRGASQLRKSTSTPSCILDKRVDFPGNLFYDSCAHVRKIKGDDLNIVSPTLASLSEVQTWSKVADGLFKMYCAECLDKFQIMQHFHFGRLLNLF